VRFWPELNLNCYRVLWEISEALLQICEKRYGRREHVRSREPGACRPRRALFPGIRA